MAVLGVVMICDPLRSFGGPITQWSVGVRMGPSGAMVVRGFWLVRAETRRVGVEAVGERSGGAGFTCPGRLGSSGPCPGAVRRLRPWSGRRNELWGMPLPRVAAPPQAAPLRRVLQVTAASAFWPAPAVGVGVSLR